MLKKLLKYDFQSILKYWWIAAISSLALSFVGGGSLSVLTSDKELPILLEICAIFALILVVISFVAFFISTTIFVYIRFYKNFFTDEGYLTFTLPVKRSQLLNSKLIMSVVVQFVTFLLYLLEIVIVICIGLSDSMLADYILPRLQNAIQILWHNAGGYAIVYVLELLIMLFLIYVFSTLFTFCCITFASIIAKKAKLLAAIGIYYAASSIYSFMVQMFYLFGLDYLIYKISILETAAAVPVVAWGLFGMISFISIFCALLYTLQYWMLDRKLNLS